MRNFLLKKLSSHKSIKHETQGQMPEEVYVMIRTLSSTAPGGHAVEIGSGQGGATVAIGLGMEDAKKKGHVFAFEKCVYSSALPSWDQKETNLNVLNENIWKFGLEKRITVYGERVENVYRNLPSDEPLGLLCIDADGALDRDFLMFYERLAPGAFVIIDDYENKIKIPQAVDFRLDPKRGEKEAIAEYVQFKTRKRFMDLCPLGKELTTYRFVNYFLKEGFLEKRQVIKKTFFGMKPQSFKKRTLMPHDLSEIRKQIEQEYFEMKDRMYHAQS